MLIGPTARGLATAPAAAPTGDVALRGATSPDVTAIDQDARTVAAQFTMSTRYHAYGGFELETGVLEERGSSFGGAYGVLGAEHVTPAGSIGAELVAGWRGIRAASGETDVNDTIVEPRVRAQLRLGSQVTLGAVAGATLGELGSWMAGLNVGFHSRALRW
ncbi:MAG: hypothetical protein H0X17_20850 [Deltaproteobacteria bacterium]|nr:hypothetical protein [Deltaproteobacteria bacterium]